MNRNFWTVRRWEKAASQLNEFHERAIYPVLLRRFEESTDVDFLIDLGCALFEGKLLADLAFNGAVLTVKTVSRPYLLDHPDTEIVTTFDEESLRVERTPFRRAARW